MTMAMTMAMDEGLFDQVLCLIVVVSVAVVVIIRAIRGDDT